MSSVSNVPFSSPGGERQLQDSERMARAAAIAAMTEHPAMPDAMRFMFSSLDGLIKGNRLMNLIVSDRSRMIMGWLTLMLDAGYDRHDRFSGLTVNRYKALCARAGLSSPGRGAAMLGLMRFAGYLEPAARASRGQPLRLVPTEKLLRQQRERVRITLKSIAHIRPEQTSDLARLDDPAFFNALLRSLAELYLTRERLIEYGPDLSFFAERKSGLMILMGLVLSARPNDTMPPAGPISVSVKELARRCVVARSQVRELLRNGVAAGLLVPDDADGSAYRVAPRLRASVLGFVGAIFLLLIDAMAMVQNEIDDGVSSNESVA